MVACPAAGRTGAGACEGRGGRLTVPELFPYNPEMLLSSSSVLALGPQALRIVLWSLAVLAAFLLGGAVVFYWLKRRLLSDDESDRPPGFTLESLERLRDEGQLTEEEFRRLRKSALGLDVGTDRRHNRAVPSPRREGEDDRPLAGDSRDDRREDSSGDGQQEKDD